MKKKVSTRIRKLLSCNVASNTSPNHSIGVHVREEYANAFRTESYIDFWARVIELSCGATAIPAGSTTSAQLPSYRLFAEYLLDPDQSTVTQILSLARTRPTIHALLSDYFTQTANASFLCGLLLKDIETTRVKFRSHKTFPKSLEKTQISEMGFRKIFIEFTELLNYVNPFISYVSSPNQFLSLQSSCSVLLQLLESSRNKAGAKLRLIDKVKYGSALVLVVVTASLSVIIVTHALPLLVAVSSLIPASIELASSRKLARVMAQLDAAAKGMYILCRDLDTISRLVSRLNDELEHIRTMSKFWLERKDRDWLRTSCEVTRQIMNNESNFNERLDELEEHLYLCFMTINRARKILVKEILHPA